MYIHCKQAIMRKVIFSYRYTITKFFYLIITTCISASALSQPYNYSIKPGSQVWKSFNTHDEMIKAVQVPDSVLKRLSTKDLIQTCLSYPLAFDYLAFDNLKNGYERTFKNFNGFRELTSRNDAGKELLRF